MAQDSKKIINEVKAFARGIHISPKKVRLVTDLLKNMPLDKALTNLQFLNKKAGGPITKLVNSGVANAVHNFQIEREKLFIKSISVDEGPALKRFKPHAQGRAFPIRRRTSHINLVLGVSSKTVKAKIKPTVVEKIERKEAITPEKSESGKKSKFGFWRKTRPVSQIPSKHDVPGKHHTNLDRRAGE